MKRTRHTAEQIIRKLKTAEQLIAQGKTVADVCRVIEVTQPTYHRWRQQYGGMQRLDHQAGCRITVTACEQVLPEVPPALVGEEVALVAAMQQGAGLGAQAIDQVLKVNAPGPGAMAATAIDAGQLADPVAAQIHDQPVMV